MKQYINKTLAREFRNSLPEINKKKTGQKPINSDDSSYGVAGNTFRAYRGWKKKPSEVYKKKERGQPLKKDNNNKRDGSIFF